MHLRHFLLYYPLGGGTFQGVCNLLHQLIGWLIIERQ